MQLIYESPGFNYYQYRKKKKLSSKFYHPEKNPSNYSKENKDKDSLEQHHASDA